MAIIGAGLAGLSAAIEVQKSGHSFLLVEKSDGVGGRVRTDEVNGYLLDRGFQIFLSGNETGSLFQFFHRNVEP